MLTLKEQKVPKYLNSEHLIFTYYTITLLNINYDKKSIYFKE